MYLFWLYSVIHVKLIATISCRILAGQAVQQYIGKKWQTFSFPSTDTAQPAQSSSGKLFIVPDPNICSFLNSMVNLFKLTKNISFYTVTFYTFHHQREFHYKHYELWLFIMPFIIPHRTIKTPAPSNLFGNVPLFYKLR